MGLGGERGRVLGSGLYRGCVDLLRWFVLKMGVRITGWSSIFGVPVVKKLGLNCPSRPKKHFKSLQPLTQFSPSQL